MVNLLNHDYGISASISQVHNRVEQAARHGIELEVDAGAKNVAFKAAVKPPRWLLAGIEKHKEQIIEILWQEAFADERAVPSSPSD